MMSRSNTFPSLSSSRQMMMAWKVSGLSHRLAIIASRPASMRLAMAISPSRDRSSTEPISRRYMRTGSSVRADSSDLLPLAGAGRFSSTISPPSFCISAVALPPPVRFDHLGLVCEDALDLLGIDLLGGQHRADMVMGDVAALLGGADELLD